MFDAARTVVGHMIDGKKLRAYRRMQRLTVDELAAKAGCSQPHLTKIENGQARASVELLNAVADALGVPALSIESEEPYARRSGHAARENANLRLRHVRVPMPTEVYLAAYEKARMYRMPVAEYIASLVEAKVGRVPTQWEEAPTPAPPLSLRPEAIDGGQHDETTEHP